MKRLLLLISLSLLGAPLAMATTDYINYGVVSVVCPPGVPPQIDASNFVNYGTFQITNLNVDPLYYYLPPLPYETWNTRNYTNFNRILGDSGYKFDYFDSVGQTNGWSANFQNAGNVNETNAYIFGATYLQVAATNIVNKGSLSVSGPGVLTLAGKTVDLTRGTIGGTGNETNDFANSLDRYWNVDGISFYSNVFDTIFVPNNFYTPTQLVQTIEYLPHPPHYAYFLESLHLTNGTPLQPPGYTSYVTVTPDANNPYLTHTEILFLSQPNPAITTEVRFWPSYAFTGGSFPNGPYWFENSKVVRFESVLTNRATGAITTNRLYFADTNNIYVNGPQVAQSPVLVQTVRPYLPPPPFVAATFRPSNYGITHVYPTFANGDLVPPTIMDFNIFAVWNILFPGWSTSYGAIITANPFSYDPSISGATYTNMPGRVEILATKALNLERTIMDGESYLSLQCTNHFIGSSNAHIIAPFSDINLATTNGTLKIANLVAPTVPRMCGEIDVWTGKWQTHLVPANPFPTTSNVFNVTVIDSHLEQQTVSKIQNLTLRSTNLFISDALNVFGSLLLDAQRLTITTNALNAPTPNGELNLSSGDLTWSASLPRLAYLTNYGKISSLNSIFFGGARMPPWFTGVYDEPYQAFVTHGLLLAEGDTIWANYFEASGTNSSGVGPISVQAISAIVTNGAFLATDADITFTCGSLLISNQVLEAGRSISLTITNYLDDGSLSNSVDVITNQNTWTVGGGINLWRLPTKASLLATTVTNNAFANSEVDNCWAGTNRGCSPSGFTNNAALGRLILDGQDEGSRFNFLRPDSADTALYIGTDTDNNFRLGECWGTMSPAVPFPVGGWHHVALVKSATDTIFYLDGTNRLSRGWPIPNPAAYTGLRLGRQTGPNGEYWAGSIGDVRIWSRALTDAEIQASLTNQLTGREANLVAAWQFHEGAGATCTSLGPTPVVGTLINGPVWITPPPRYGLSFNGTSAYVDTATGVIPSSGDFTVECWVTCPTASSSCREILSQGSPGNALYVDLLELKDVTANADSVGHFVGMYLQPNFTIYYGDAVWNGLSIAEQLNGRYGVTGTDGGHFCWVSNYNTGFFSSTNVTYTDGSGTHRLNRALVESCSIDSNGNGIPNCLDPNPVPVLTTPSTPVLKAVYTNLPVRSVVLSWNTIPLASNYLYASSSPLLLPTTNWQLVTNFLSDATIGGRATVTDRLQTSGGRYYRVRVLSP